MATRQSTCQPAYTVCADKPKYRSSNAQGICTLNTCRNLEPLRPCPSEGSKGYARRIRSHEKENWVSEFKIMAGHGKSAEIRGDETYKYFRRPIIPFLVPKSQTIEIPVRFEHEILNDVVKNAQKQCYIFPPKPEPHKTVATQTDYRDSEAQTIPWEPQYKVRPGHNPETLTIAHLTWNHGLPAGVHEVEIINRMRMKRAWEEILPPMDTEENIKLRTAIISAIEVDEWAFRESEIQAIMDYRMQLMEELTQIRQSERQKKIQGRFDRLNDTLGKRRDKEVNDIRHKLRRELRKLRKKHQEKRPVKRDIIREHADPSSEIYAPQMRHGEHPQRRHEVIRKDLLGESYLENADRINTLPNHLPTYEELKAIKPKPKPTDLCIRETRWTEEKLEQLHFDLKAIRFRTAMLSESTLMRRKYKPPKLPTTPYRSNTENLDETQLHRASTLIQKIVKGRAIQCMMFEGRDRCRELIEELQSTHALEERSKRKLQKEKMHMIDLQRMQNDRSVNEDRLCMILNSLEGTTVSGLLDFLSKELIRLEDERRIHAFALLAERERNMREAAEAGRRQLERHRRREFDEIFTQLMKVNQDSVEVYLEDIIKEGIEWVSEKAAKEYILELCDKVDSITEYAEENATELAQEEMVANMIYNFVLPEVEKHNIRKNIRDNQQSYLQNAHAEIYKQIMNLPPVQVPTSSHQEDEIGPEGEECDEKGSDISTLGTTSIQENIVENPIPTAEDVEIIHGLLESVIGEVGGNSGEFSSESSSPSSKEHSHD